jgi:uncharacterized protein (TIGR01777 family)
MKIVITGGTGFLGRHLSSVLLASGHEMVLIRRSDLMNGAHQISKLIKSSDVLINLAGSPVIKRWTDSNRKEMLESRLNTTNVLVDSLSLLSPEERPSIFLSGSAIGIYDSINLHTESSLDFDTNFLASVCKKWEACLEPLENLNLRVCVMRIGIVLGKDGGMLKKLIPLFKTGLGGKIGSGKQAFSFIHYLDFCNAVQFLIGNKVCNGIFNLTAPEVSTNSGLTRILADAFGRPAFFTVPETALKLLYGEAAVSMIKGQAVYPKHLLDSGFEFSYPDLRSAVRDIVSQP